MMKRRTTSSMPTRTRKRPDGVKKEKEKLEKQAESSSIRDKMDDMMKSREHLVNKTLETKVMLMEKKSQEKQMRWALLREDEKTRSASMRGEHEPKKSVPIRLSKPPDQVT
jgi:hypothetical protein